MIKSILWIPVLLVTAATVPAYAQKGVGAKFGARDPRPCTPQKNTGKAPSAEQLKQAFVCDEEKVTKSIASGEQLNLLTDLAIEIGSGRPFNMRTDSWPDVDPSKTVYPIRGGYTWWRCGVVGTIGNPPGKNCTKMEEPHATGICYTSSFGEWHCKFMDKNATFSPTMEQFSAPAGH